MLNLSLGLIGLITINIVLGSLDSWFKKNFDKKKCLEGIIKGIVVSICAVGLYYIGYYNPDVLAIQMGDTEVNLQTAVYGLVLAGFIMYGKQCIEKLSKVILGK